MILGVRRGSRGLLRDLRRIVGAGAVRAQPGELLAYASDALTLYRGTPLAVVFPETEAQVARLCRYLYARGVPFVPRGAGTGLSGGAVADGAVCVETSRMNRILELDPANRRARVQPGVPNAVLGAAAARFGLAYAPDPSSQVACTLGGNVAENSGGPHCLKYGVTVNHVLGLRTVLPDGEVVGLPGPGGPGYDLVGLFVGSEGTLGIATEIELRLVRVPEAVATVLAHFDAVADAGRAVSAVIARGIVPAALEMVDRETIRAVEASVYAAGFPTDVAASLLVEVDGPRAGVAEEAARVVEILRAHGARQVRRARDEAERARFWAARKKAFGAMGRLAPDLLVQDATVPRSRLPEVLDRIAEIARRYRLTVTNVFHAGDGNLHPNIPFDRRDPDQTERVRAASKEIMAVCVAAGGTITGEHGVGLDKRAYMEMVYTPDDLAAQRAVKRVWDPKGLCNPGKVLPDAAADGVGVPADAAERGGDRAGGQRLGAARPARDPEAVVRLVERAAGAEACAPPESWPRVRGRALPLAVPGSVDALAECVGAAARDGVRLLPAGLGTWLDAGGAVAADLVLSVRRLDRVLAFDPEDLVASVQAGVTLRALDAALAPGNEEWPVDPPGTEGTVGAAIATGAAGPLAAGYGLVRDNVLGLTVVTGAGRVVRPGGRGGRVVKNVAGYDLTRLFAGSWGTLGVLVEAHLRLAPRPEADATLAFAAQDARPLLALGQRLDAAPLRPVACECASPTAAAALGLADGGPSMSVMWARWRGGCAGVAAGLEAARAAARDLDVRVAGGPEPGPAAGAPGGTQRGRMSTADTSSRASGIWGAMRELDARTGAELVVRVEARPAGLAGVVGAAAELGSALAWLASPALGRAWVFVPGPLDPDTWARRLAAWRRDLEARGGRLVVERAPEVLLALSPRSPGFDPWGDPGGAVRILRGLKEAFDPAGVLAPGRFRWA